jgi:membrane protease YdiL (CAAX protease family)
VSFEAQLIGELILTVVVLLWARWSKLDLGLRAPVMNQVWPWALLYMAWIGAERIAASFSPVATDFAWLQELEQLSPVENILLTLVIGPITEELLYRGALFSALTRRWGLRTAVVVPSILWALFHSQYELWLITSIALSGVLLAIIRWKSGSLSVPIGLHVAGNLFDLVSS